MNIKMVKYYSNPNNCYELLGFFVFSHYLYKISQFYNKIKKHKKL